MPGPLNTIFLTLLEATVTLYPANRAGQPVLSQPLWTGVAVADLTVQDRWIKVETRATGAPYPRKHNLSPQFEITLGRVWALPLAQMAGFTPARDHYVLDVVWREEDTLDWHRETFYGVTINERSRAAHDRDGEFVDNQVFDAEYVSPPTCGKGVPPPIELGVPLTVHWVDEAGDVLLYSYSPNTKAFTPQTSLAGRATVSGSLTTAFRVVFADVLHAAMRVTADHKIETFSFRQTWPDPSRGPRLDFYYGTNRIGSLTRAGEFHASHLRIQPPLAGADRFEFYAPDGTLAGTLAVDGLAANAFHVFGPGDLTGLKLWVAVEDLTAGDAPVDLVTWPDRSGTADLLGVGKIHYGETDPLELEPDGRPWVYLGKDGPSYLHNGAATSLPVDNHVVFVVGKPGLMPDDPDPASMSIFSTTLNPWGPGSAVLAQYENVLVGHFWTSDGLQLATGTTPLARGLVGNERWWLMEQEVSGANLRIRLNGALEAATVLTGTKPGVSREIFLGKSWAYAGYGGLLRAALVYTGLLTDEAKSQVRQYLNNHYQLYQ